MHAESIPGARGEAEAQARAARLGRPVLLSQTSRVPDVDVLDEFARASAREAGTDRGLWLRPGQDEAVFGLGAAAVLSSDARDPFRAIARDWADLLDQAVIDTGEAAGQPAAGPLLLGAFAFDPRRPRTRLWSGFPNARLVLPERTLVRVGGATWLTTNTLVGASRRASPPPASPRFGAAADMLDGSDWQSLVGSVAAAIRSEEAGLQKVVLARAETVIAERAFDLGRAARQLAASYPTCTVFALGQSDACFLGATPERLVSLRDGLASSMALAASIGRGATEAEDAALADRLLHDPKERAEHAIVVRALKRGLAGPRTRIMADTEPRVQKLSNVQHLLTRIEAHVPPERGVLDIVRRLHPTPAVGGFPRARALALLREREQLDRGWYAGPVGWLNARGEGEFVVGIRSALVRGNMATLFAGCGIVADSRADAELVESGWKLRPMRAALGA